MPQFLADYGDRSLLVSHYLFRDYEPELGEAFFTWIRNPLDMFVSGFRYWQREPVRGEEFRPDMAEFMRKVPEFEDLRAYVDYVLEANPSFVFPRGLFDRDWRRYDFIGQTGRMAESLTRFNDRYGTNLPYKHVNRSGAQGIRYRRDDLEVFFRPELEIFDDLTTGKIPA